MFSNKGVEISQTGDRFVSKKISPLGGIPLEGSKRVDVARLVTAYYQNTVDASVPSQRVAFGTSGHCGSSFENSFNESHILPALLRPESGTEDIYKIYAESFRGEDHLRRILPEAQAIVDRTPAAS